MNSIEGLVLDLRAAASLGRPITAQEVDELEAALSSRQGEAVQVAAPGDVERLQRAYWLGWRNSAAWADRKDLWADRDSKAYTQERDDDLGSLAAALRSQEPAYGPDGSMSIHCQQDGCQMYKHPPECWSQGQADAVVETEWIVSCGSGAAPALRFDNEPAAFARWAEEVSIPSYIRSGRMRQASVTKVTTISEDRTAAALAQQANKDAPKVSA